ncbi:hypothetical protein WMZ97_12955 [Lentibacillus sp. N15]|uniref:hypothetical protein n=1 Tax=Lentibacillus songyuanensis TaxID=3136161 RepID=UPI0031BA3803
MARRKKRKSELVPALIAIAIVLALSSFFAPFVFITIVQDAFHQQVNGIWMFAAPLSSYIVGGAALLYLALVVVILAFYQSKVKGKKLRKAVGTFVAFVPGIIFIYLSMNQYFYFTDRGIYQNHLFAMHEHFYPWSEMEQAQAVSKNKDGQVSLARLELTTKQHKVLHYRYTTDLIHIQRDIRDALDEYDVGLEQKLEGKEAE